MKRPMKGLVAAGLMSLALPALAREATGSGSTTGTQGAQQGTTQRYTTYNGVVKEVDKDKNMVTLQLPLAPNASVLKDGQRASIDDLKEGDDVRASFDPSSNKIIRLDIQSSKKTAPPMQENQE
jgi:Cu/Ag efflux protein CusF